VSLLAQDGALARRVGAITLLVLAAAIACFVFLLDRIALGSPTRIRVMFRHTAGLREQAPLIVAGQPIGRVAAITPHRAAGEVGVAVTIAVERDHAWKVPAGGEIFVASRGPLSEKYLEIAPPRGEPGRAIHDGQELRGVDPPSLDGVLYRTWANMLRFREFVDAIRPELAALRDQLDQLRGSLASVLDDPRAAGGVGALAAAIGELVDTARHTRDTSLGGAPGLARLQATIEHARAAIAELRAAIDRLDPQLAALATGIDRVRGHLASHATLSRAQQAITAARAVLDKLDPLLASAGELAALIASGEGSVGRLMRDPEFPEDAKDIGKLLKRRPWRILERPRD
jgi:ABC-type transporter Mla subunit MlaD